MAVLALWVMPAFAASINFPHVQAKSAIQAGKYLILAGGCNDCHTFGWEQSHGTFPTSKWLTGNPVGYKGPWGVTYAKNLRLLVAHMTVVKWVKMFKAEPPVMLPPMPVEDYSHLSVRDIKAIYVFIKSLGPDGKLMPKNLKQGEAIVGPYVNFMPKNLSK